MVNVKESVELIFCFNSFDLICVFVNILLLLLINVEFREFSSVKLLNYFESFDFAICLYVLLTDLTFFTKLIIQEILDIYFYTPYMLYKDFYFNKIA